MSTRSEALYPWLYPAPDRLWWGQCSQGCTLYLTKEETDSHREATKQREVLNPEHPRITVPLMLPCGHVWYSTLNLYKRSDGTFF